MLKVCQDFNITLGELLGSSRIFELMDARTVIALTLFKIGYTKVSIGEALNRKDHTTIINILNRGEKREDLKNSADKYVSSILEQ